MPGLKNLKFMFFFLLFGFCILDFAYATPSTTYWTPDTMDVQPYKKWHVTYDSYFTVGRRGSEKGDLTTDVGLTVGVLSFEKLNMELGFDINEPLDEPLTFNGKLGIPECALFKDSPGINFGIFNVGTKKGVNDQNIFDFIVGKTLLCKPIGKPCPMPTDGTKGEVPLWNLGRVHLGYYVGNGNTLRSAGADKENQGFMIAYDKFIYKDKVMLAMDYASGKNAIGGGGFGLYYFFTKDIDLLAGPVWFNDQTLNGNMKWTMQLDINF